ncbi:MAG: hypothetical protein FWF02_07550 [Micrococcales bacterium]|nr:hypothetical protein [Micrococcales bacterium]MCL2667547.1 hypothetical protein [Micrococcales bacterium]
MGWFGQRKPRRDAVPAGPALPEPPTGTQILDAVTAVERRIAGRVPPLVVARVHRIATVVTDMVPRLDRLGAGTRQAHTVVATATNYLPEAVDAYLRLPRDFADTREVSRGKTSLMLLVDQLDLLATTLQQISDAVSRHDAQALVVHGAFLAEKFGPSSTLELPGGEDA